MTVTWGDIAAIVSVVGFLLGLATIYLRLLIRTETSNMRDATMKIIEPVFVRADLNNLQLKHMSDRIQQMLDRIEAIERRLERRDKDDESRRVQ